ncbi:MAG TPA: hypothetical protein VIF37_16280 [Methylobacter sp.]|jgi:archaellum component FlaC
MSINVVGEWLDVIYKVLTGIFVIWLYFDRRNDKTLARVTKLEGHIDDKLDTMEKRLDEQLDDHSERLVKVESDLRNQPKHEDLGKIYDEMRKVSESIAGMASNLSGQKAMLEGLEKQVSRMDTFWRTHSN